MGVGDLSGRENRVAKGPGVKGSFGLSGMSQGELRLDGHQGAKRLECQAKASVDFVPGVFKLFSVEPWGSMEVSQAQQEEGSQPF